MPNPMDWKQALAMLIPATAAGLQGGGAGLGGFATGFTRGRGVYDEMQNRQGYLDLAQQRETYNQSRDVIEDQQRAEMQKQAQAAQWIKVLESVPGLREEAFNLAEESGANTPELATEHARQTMNDWMASIGKLLPGSGQMDPLIMARMAAVTPQHASMRFQKQWADEYRTLTKGLNDTQLKALRANPAPMVSPATGKRWPVPFAEMEQRLGMADLPAMKQQNFQSKNVKGVMRDGGYFEGMANFDPEQGKYFTVDGQELRSVRDAPAAPTIQIQTPGGLPTAVQRRVDATSRSYESVAVVKNMQKVAEAIEFAGQLDPNTKNPADDQALIYNFAKAMDPDSVVREGEYAVVQKYAQSWAEKFGFDVKRMYSNSQFLTPEARANMKATITAKGKAAHNQYLRVRQQYADKINRITGSTDGDEYLIDFGVMMPSGTQGSTASGADPVARLLQGKPDGRYTMTDGSVYLWKGGTATKEK